MSTSDAYGVVSDRIRRAARARRIVSTQEKLAAITDDQWHHWMAERWSQTRVARAVGVRIRAITNYVSARGWKWPRCLPEPRSSSGRPSRPRERARTQVRQPDGWTWFDYVEQTDREFATPHHLRKAPAIRDWLVKNGVKP